MPRANEILNLLTGLINRITYKRNICHHFANWWPTISIIIHYIFWISLYAFLDFRTDISKRKRQKSPTRNHQQKSSNSRNRPEEKLSSPLISYHDGPVRVSYHGGPVRVHKSKPSKLSPYKYSFFVEPSGDDSKHQLSSGRRVGASSGYVRKQMTGLTSLATNASIQVIWLWEHKLS